MIATEFPGLLLQLLEPSNWKNGARALRQDTGFPTKADDEN
jgi:hypothetical protein